MRLAATPNPHEVVPKAAELVKGVWNTAFAGRMLNAVLGLSDRNPRQSRTFRRHYSARDGRQMSRPVRHFSFRPELKSSPAHSAIHFKTAKLICLGEVYEQKTPVSHSGSSHPDTGSGDRHVCNHTYSTDQSGGPGRRVTTVGMGLELLVSAEMEPLRSAITDSANQRSAGRKRREWFR
jgi:hypothetical protein